MHAVMTGGFATIAGTNRLRWTQFLPGFHYSFNWLSPAFTAFHLGMYSVLIGFQWVSFSLFLWAFTGLYWVVLGFVGFYWILLGFNGFH